MLLYNCGLVVSIKVMGDTGCVRGSRMGNRECWHCVGVSELWDSIGIHWILLSMLATRHV
jgi:hypothetical protein